MPILVTVVEELDADPAQVWDLVTDVQAYPTYMDSVRTIEVLTDWPMPEPAPPGTQAEVIGWEIEIEGAVMRWVELEIRDSARRTVDFRQLRGDLDLFEGYWRITPRPAGGSLVELSVTFEIGLDLLREVLNPYAADAIGRNSRSMLRALNARRS